MKNEEHLEQCAFFDWLRLVYPKIYKITFAIPNGGQRNIITAARLKKEGVKAGVPDIFVPQARGVWHGLFIEMKSKKGRLSKFQVDFMWGLLDAGYQFYECHSWEAAKDSFESYIRIK